MRIPLLMVLLLLWSTANGKENLKNNGVKDRKPNIILILADDMGWNDAGWHNEDIYSPNMNRMAREGIRLNQSYFLPICSPSRVSLMTGYYAFRTGLQEKVMSSTTPFGVPLKFPLMSEKMREQGYSTHLVGKWNLGYCSWEYTPTFRGFDSFFGHYQAVQHYYNHTCMSWHEDPEGPTSYDFRNNTDVAWEYQGIHSSIPFIKQIKHIIQGHDPAGQPLFLFFSTAYPHIPHEVPPEFEDIYKNSSVKNPHRRGFMARLSAMDNDIGQIVALLQEHGLYENSIIAFTSDNGGVHYSGGNNYPLRGGKFTMYEGGTRVPGFFYSPLLPKKGFVYNGLMHAVDWFPTLLAIAGGQPDTDMDGFNLWPYITQNLKSPRQELVYNLIDTKENPRMAIRVDDWKLIFGRSGSPHLWYKPEEVLGIFNNNLYEYRILERDPTDNTSLQLFNLAADPYETTDLSQRHPSRVKYLMNRLERHRKQHVRPFIRLNDMDGHPDHYGGIFTPGWCRPILEPVDLS